MLSRWRPATTASASSAQSSSARWSSGSRSIAFIATAPATADARGVLPAAVPRAIALHQMAQVGAMVAACWANDLALLGRAIDDRIAEPARAPLIPGFVEAKQAALDAGALGASISGAGPTAFALTDGDDLASRVAAAMADAYARCGIACQVRVTEVDRDGARVEVE